MNKDQINGAVKEVAGKVQARVSEVVGNTAQPVKRHIREAEGKVQHLFGDAKTLATTAAHKL